jgi:hypothetical protein
MRDKPAHCKSFNFRTPEGQLLTQRHHFGPNALDTPYRLGDHRPEPVGMRDVPRERIDTEVLPELTESDLSQLGVALGPP